MPRTHPDPGASFRVAHGVLPHPAFAAAIAAVPAVTLVPLPLADPAAARALLAGCEAYYCMASRDELPVPLHVTPELLAAAPRLLLVASTGAGYDTADPAACTAAGVLLVNQAGANAEGVAEHAVGMMLTLLKRIPEAAAAMRAGTAGDRTALMGRELAGRTVGLVGIGHVGTRVAAILRGAFGCRVLATDPLLDAAAIRARGAEPVGLPELLASSDVVSLHCPLSAATRGLIGRDALAHMREGAILVTTARGDIHDEAAVAAALASGRLGGAGLDVWATEPPPRDHPLLAAPNVLVSQHTAGVTHESRERIARYAAQAILAVAGGDLPPRVVNPEVIPRALARLQAGPGRG